jgi:hypothetical protein
VVVKTNPAHQKALAQAYLEQQRRYEQQRQMVRNDVAHFIGEYVFILDATERDWIRFELWPAQAESLAEFLLYQLIVILKARQIGMTWLALAFALWLALFHPVATILLFSRRDDEAKYILERLKGMYRRLPAWMQTTVLVDNDHVWALANGSEVRAFPPTAGDSYTATLVIVDEADLIPDFGRLMDSVKPTIDGGGKMIVLSRVNKDTPGSEFQLMYSGAKAGKTDWHPIFLPWHVRPGRTLEWYESQKREILTRTGALDSLYAQYPATDVEAMAPNTLDKRIAPQWLLQCYVEQTGIKAFGDLQPPAIPGLTIYRLPESGHQYVGGVDPAEGNPNSDDSSATFIDVATGEEVAALSGRFEPGVFASYVHHVAMFFNKADLLVERNNHGHAVQLWFREHSTLTLLHGHDDPDPSGTDHRKAGWLSNERGKSLLYTTAATAFRDKTTIIHSFLTYQQLASIDGSTLRAPNGQLDDRADSYALALEARHRAERRGTSLKAASSRTVGRGEIFNRGRR